MHAASVFEVLSVYQTSKQPEILDIKFFLIMLYILVVKWDIIVHTVFNGKHMETHCIH